MASELVQRLRDAARVAANRLILTAAATQIESLEVALAIAQAIAIRYHDQNFTAEDAEAVIGCGEALTRKQETQDGKAP